MKKAKDYMMKMLKPNTGISSKRFISVGGFLFLCFIALIDLFTNLTVSNYVYEGLVFVVTGAIGGTAVENYANRTKIASDEVAPDAVEKVS